MRATAVLENNTLQVVDIPQPTPSAYQARIRNEVACICNTTDRKLVQGHFPNVETYPLLLGHETVGIVEAVGEKVRNFKVGDRVVGGLLIQSTDPAYASGWGGFSDYTLAGDHQAMVEDGVATPEHGWYEVDEIMRVVPPSIGLEDAVLLCMWREVYSAFTDFNLKPTDSVVIFGDGPVALSFIKFASLMGFPEIHAVGKYPARHAKMMEMGATSVLTPDDAALEAFMQTRGKPVDAVIDAVGKESIINAALKMIRLGGSICVYGSIDEPVVRLEKIKGPFNFNLLIHQWPTRYGEQAAQAPLVEWIEAGKLGYQEFITSEFPFAQIAEAYQTSQLKTSVKTLIRF